jgi:hypothetical protein
VKYIPIVLVVLLCGCSMIRNDIARKASEIARQDMQKDFRAIVREDLERTVSVGISRILGDTVIDTAPWTLSILAGGGWAMSMAKRKKPGVDIKK